MDALVHAMLSNALVAVVLALAPLSLTWLGRSPALIHKLWLVVLLKLVTPPVVEIPLGFPSPDYRVIGPELPAPRSAGPHEEAIRDGRPEPPADAGDELLLPLARDEHGPLPEQVIESSLGEPRDHESWSAGADWHPSVSRPIAGGSSAIGWPPLPRWEVLVFTVVLAGGIACWMLAAARIVRLHWMLRDVRPAPLDVQEHVNAVARYLGLRHAPKVGLTPGRIPPMLWALGGRSRLILPSELWHELDQDQQTSLLAHELAHLRRRDHWVRWLDLTVTGLYWWHPVFWWARRGMREAEEQCCDAWAVWAMPGGARSYAAALLAALEFVSDTPTAGVAAASAMTSARRHVSFLKRRMTMIVRARTPRELGWVGSFGVLALALLILPLAPTWAQKPDSAVPDRDRDRPAVGADGRLPDATRDLQVAQADKTRQEPKAEADDDDDDKDTKEEGEAGEHLERLLKDLGDRLSKDLGPVAQEVAKTLERAAKDVSEALDKDGVVSKDVQEALEKARDEIDKSFKSGGPLETQAREAAEKARKDLSETVEKARRELSQAVRDRAERAREAVRDRLPREAREEDEPAEQAESREKGDDLEQARRDVRQMEQQLRRATRRLEAIERREQRSSRSARRAPATPARPPVPPRPPHPPAPPESPEGASAPPSPPATEPPTTPPGPRGFRGPGMGPGGMRGPGMGGPGGPILNPRVERRLRDLEDKMDRLLKELKDLKEERSDRPTRTET